MMLHYSAADYDVAASAAAKSARTRMQRQFDGSDAVRNKLIRQLVSDTPIDALVRPEVVRFGVQDGGVVADYGNGVQVLESNAIGQLAGFTSVQRDDGEGKTRPILGRRNVNAMLDAGPWGQELLVDSLAKIFKNVNRDHMRFRSVGLDDNMLEGRAPDKMAIRSVVSASYQSFDSAGLLASTLKAAGECGAVPVRAHYDGLRWTLKLYLPHVFEPVDNEVMAFGMIIGHSDHGRGALEARFVSQRLWCTNEAIAETMMRRVHLGKRLDANAWSGDTLRKANELLESQIGDVTRRAMSPDRIGAECTRIRLANEAALTGQEAGRVVDGIARAVNMTQDLREGVKRAFNTPDVEMLPPGNSMWRLAQSFGLVAQQTSVLPVRGNTPRLLSVEDRLALEDAAGRVLEQVMPAPTPGE